MTMRDISAVTELPADTPLETRWIFDRLNAVSTAVDRALADYRFDEAANAIYQFFWGELCDWYLELVKLRLNFDTSIASSPEAVILSGAKNPDEADATETAKELSAPNPA